ncbi:MAG TPA: tetratricopeptide repeat protein [Gemmatimonadaceae bacterium]|nr:tetratricopeptide repeat protein [Gemmatimonadaceae bacterium]
MLVAAIAVLAGSAVYAIHTLYAAIAHEKPIARVEGDDQFAVIAPAAVRPNRSAYEAFARDDALWRARNAPRVDWWSLEEGPYVWHKPPRQAVTDSAFLLTQAGRLSDAADVIDGWLATHPSDTELLLESARIDNSLGRTAATVTRYRQLLALEPRAEARAELAAALLAGQRYVEAAEEYRRLVAREPASRDHRLGLARALLWGERPREAEQLLRGLWAAAPGDSSVVALLHAARASYDPNVSEARNWVAEESTYAPYRLAYARALVNEGLPSEAAEQFDILLAGGATATLLREAAAAHGAANDSSGAAALLGRAVALEPPNDSLRLDYARALAWSGDSQRAIEQYGVLIAHQPTAGLLLARGQLYVWHGDNDRGAADLRRSVAMSPSYEGYALLGDVARWEGRFDESRAMYLRALALVPNDPRVTVALAELRRRQTLYVASIGRAEDGWSTETAYTEDNTGFLFLAAGMSTGIAVDDQTVIGVGVEQRRVAQRSANARQNHVDGFAADLRAQHRFGSHVTLSAAAGLARHARVRDMGFGGVALDWERGRVSGSVAVGTGPVYGSLMSLATLVPAGVPNASAGPIVGRTASASVSVPVGSASLTVSGERLELSDGNARNLVSAAVRVPLASNVAAIYDGSVMGFARQSDLYWDPHRYTSQAVGIEVTGQPARGLSVAVRALPGLARSEEPVVAPGGNTSGLFSSRQAFEFSTGGELRYHVGRWDASAAAGYGRGREGNYQSLNGSIRLHMKW